MCSSLSIETPLRFQGPAGEPSQNPDHSRALTHRLRSYQEGPSTECLGIMVPTTNKGMVSGTRVLKYWALGIQRVRVPKKLGSLALYLGPESLNIGYFQPLGKLYYPIPK